MYYANDCICVCSDTYGVQSPKLCRTGFDLETYTSIFQNADFSPELSQKGAAKFPESFSYEDQGVIIISIPVSHALGDFALIEYTPETK